MLNIITLEIESKAQYQYSRMSASPEYVSGSPNKIIHGSFLVLRNHDETL